MNRLAADYGELSYTKDKLRDALDAYNSDPGNIAQGLAPMREDPDNPNSALVTFPN